MKEGTNTLEERYEHVLGGKLAPGMSGSFEIDINPGDTEVDFNYEIILESVDNAPAHLHFYTQDSDEHQNKKNDQDTDGDEIVVNPTEEKVQTTQGKEYLKGTVNAGSASNKSEQKKVIYWEWPYEDPNNDMTDTKSIVGNNLQGSTGNGIPDYDDQDTLDGIKAENVTVHIKVIATQIDPGNKTNI